MTTRSVSAAPGIVQGRASPTATRPPVGTGHSPSAGGPGIVRGGPRSGAGIAVRRTWSRPSDARSGGAEAARGRETRSEATSRPGSGPPVTGSSTQAGPVPGSRSRSARPVGPPSWVAALEGPDRRSRDLAAEPGRSGTDGTPGAATASNGVTPSPGLGSTEAGSNRDAPGQDTSGQPAAPALVPLRATRTPATAAAPSQIPSEEGRRRRLLAPASTAPVEQDRSGANRSMETMPHLPIRSPAGPGPYPQQPRGTLARGFIQGQAGPTGSPRPGPDRG